MKSDRSSSKQATTRRETFILRQDGQVYGKVTKTLGDGKFECECDDYVTRTCAIRGNMRNRVYVRVDDIVLVNLYVGMNQDDKGIISFRYTDDQARELVHLGQITFSFYSSASNGGTEQSVEAFEFI
jgi:translation initiation factor 1A